MGRAGSRRRSLPTNHPTIKRFQAPMSDDPSTTDGGAATPAERDVRRAGDRPPDVPAQSTVEDLLPRLVEADDDVSTGFHIRARLAGDDPTRAAERLVEALERKVAVVGTTLDAGVDPADPQLDVLIETEHTMSQVATALARVAPVEGAIVLDVTETARLAIEEQAEEQQADAANANDVFNQLQEQVSEADYDQVVDELEDVNFPGGPDPEEEVDLEEAAGVDLADDAEEAAPDPEPETIDLGTDEETGDDEVSAQELFGKEEEGEQAGAGEPSGAEASEADESAIEAAVRSVEGSAADRPGDASAPSAPDVEAPDGAEAATGPAGDGPPPDGSEATSAGADSDAGDDVPATDGPESEATAGDAEAASAGVESAPTPASDAETAPSAGEAAGQPDATDPAATVDALVRALESGEVGPDRRQRLREALGIESTHGIDVRLEYLQKRVDNLAAYTDAWEEFLAEEGSGDRFVDDVRSRLDDLEAAVGAGDGTPDPELADRVDRLEATVEQLEADAGPSDLEARVDELERRHDEDVSRIEDRLAAISDAIEKLKRSLRQFADWRETVNDYLRK